MKLSSKGIGSFVGYVIALWCLGIVCLVLWWITSFLIAEIQNFSWTPTTSSCSTSDATTSRLGQMKRVEDLITE